MKIYRAYKVELDPTDKQRTAFVRAAGCARWAYNWGLKKKVEAYEVRKAALAAGVSKDDAQKVPTAIDLSRELNLLKKLPVEQGGVPWMYEVSKCAPQMALQNLDKAFDNFFRKCKSGKKGKKGFPQYKTRRKRVGSFTFIGAIKVTDTHTQLPRVGKVKLKEYDYLPADGVKVLSATVSEKAGRWFVSLQVEQNIPEPSYRSHLPVIGVDVGIRNLATCSDGTVFDNPKALKRSLERLKLLQRSVSRKARGGNNRRKAVRKVARQHYRTSCIRKDALHKCSTAITKLASTIVLEDLNVAGMTKNHKLARAVADSSIAELHRQIGYKASWRGVKVIVANKWFPSSKMCSGCGKVKAELPLSLCEFRCDACGLVLDRDLNAATNLKHLAAGLAVTACCPGSSGTDLTVSTKLLVGQESSTGLDFVSTSELTR